MQISLADYFLKNKCKIFGAYRYLYYIYKVLSY